MLQTGDLTEWDAMSFPTCEFCTTTHDFVVTTLGSGGSFSGGVTMAEVITVHPLAELEGGYPIDLQVTQGTTLRLDAAGNQVSSFAGSVSTARFHTVYADEAWRILGVEGGGDSK